MAQKILVVGYVSPDAQVFLAAHQVPISQYENLSIICLDEMVGALNETANPLEFVVGFWRNDDDIEEDCLIVNLNVDASETKITLRRNYWTQFLDVPRQVI